MHVHKVTVSRMRERSAQTVLTFRILYLLCLYVYVCLFAVSMFVATLSVNPI